METIIRKEEAIFLINESGDLKTPITTIQYQ